MECLDRVNHLSEEAETVHDQRKFLGGRISDDTEMDIQSFTSLRIVKLRFFFKFNFCVKPYVTREPRKDPSNRRLYEHGIYIRHCQESNSQPVPSQVRANPNSHSGFSLEFPEECIISSIKIVDGDDNCPYITQDEYQSQEFEIPSIEVQLPVMKCIMENESNTIAPGWLIS